MRDDAELTAIEKREVVDILVSALRDLSMRGGSGQAKQWAFDDLERDLDRAGFEIRRKS